MADANLANGDNRHIAALNLATEIVAEYLKARAKHGEMRSPHEGYAVLLEEVDELWDEVKKRVIDPKLMRKEAIQVAAMALAFILEVIPGDKA